MRTTHKTLLSGAALAAFLPAVALAQELTTDTTVTEVPVETIEADETMALEGEAMETELGVTEIEATSAEAMDLSTWNYDDLYANGISIEQMIGADVYGPEGDDIGNVQNVLFNMEGQVLSVVAEIGGFLDIGDTHVNIPWDMVSAETWADGIVIPFTEDEVDAYIADASYYGTSDEFYRANDGLMGADDGLLGTGVADGQEQVVGGQEIAEVGGDGFGQVETGPNVWRASDLLNNTARLRDGEAYANYGLVSDIVVRDGQIAGMLVTPDASFGATGGMYGYPYAGNAGWTRGADGTMGTYDLPYDRTQAEMIQPFDTAMLMD